MESKFISDLYESLAASLQSPNTPEQRAAGKTLLELDIQFVETMGYDFVMRYQSACDQAFAWEPEAAFAAGLRFGAQFMLSVLPYSSNSVSAP